MQLVHALILGIVEGLTEFLPVSSTAHLILTSHFLGLPETEFLKSFTIFIQLGAILAVLVLYAKRLLTDRRTLLLVATAFVPTAVIGFLLHDFVKAVLLESIPTVLWALGIGGLAMIAFEWSGYRFRAPGTRMSFRQAACIGVFQALALVPGVSRAAATIVGGQAIGVDRKDIVEFSFLLAIPTMAAATGLDLIKGLDYLTYEDTPALAIGFVAAFVVALLTVRWLIRFTRDKSFAGFGIYRIILALSCALLLW